MAAITYTFAPLSDVVLFDVAIPRKYKPIHAYCMKRLQLEGWRLQPADIALHFDCSLSTARRALRCFRDLGYAIYDMVKGWRVFPSPQATVNEALEPISGGSFLPPLEPIKGGTFDPLIERETFLKEKTTTQLPSETIITHDPVTPAVVVFWEEEKQPETITQPAPIAPVEEEKLKFPPTFTESQTKDAKRILKKLAKPELGQVILWALADVLKKGTLKTTIPRWLGWSVSYANEHGTFTHAQAADDTKTNKQRCHDDQEKIRLHRELGSKKTKSDAGKANFKDIRAQAGLRCSL